MHDVTNGRNQRFVFASDCSWHAIFSSTLSQTLVILWHLYSRDCVGVHVVSYASTLSCKMQLTVAGDVHICA